MAITNLVNIKKFYFRLCYIKLLLSFTDSLFLFNIWHMLWKRNLSVYQDSPYSFQQIYSQNPNSVSLKKSKKQIIKQKKTLNSLGVQTLTLQQSIKTKKPNTIYFYKGNNHTLVRDIFISYGYVETISKQDASIIWSQWSQQIPRIPSVCLAVNFLQNHQAITNKERLYRNLKRYNKGQNSRGKYLPDTYIIDFKSDVYDTGFAQFFTRYFGPKQMRVKLRKMQQKNQQFHIYNSHGQFRIPYRKVVLEQALLDPFIDSKPPIWILKPTSLNRGRGINLFTSLKQLKTHLSQDYHQMSMNMYQQTHSPASYVIQQYIQRPLLIQGFKFDIRMWSVVTMDRSQKKLKCYMYQEGYVRLSGTKYHQNTRNQIQQQEQDQQKNSPKKEKPSKNDNVDQSKVNGINSKNVINNKFMHLTNNSVQKYSKTYGSLYQGNIVPLKDLQKYFGGKIYLQSILSEFKQIITDSIECVKHKLGLSYTVESKKSNKGPNQFQLFGYDFLIDQSFKIWLIEVNCNPSLQESSQHLGQLIKKMLKQMVQILNLNINLGQASKQTKRRLSQLKQKYSKQQSIEKDAFISKKDSLSKLASLNPIQQKKVMKLSSQGFRKQKARDILRLSSQLQSIQIGKNTNAQKNSQKQVFSQSAVKVSGQNQLKLTVVSDQTQQRRQNMPINSQKRQERLNNSSQMNRQKQSAREKDDQNRWIQLI